MDTGELKQIQTHTHIGRATCGHTGTKKNEVFLVWFISYANRNRTSENYEFILNDIQLILALLIALRNEVLFLKVITYFNWVNQRILWSNKMKTLRMHWIVLSLTQHEITVFSYHFCACVCVCVQICCDRRNWIDTKFIDVYFVSSSIFNYVQYICGWMRYLKRTYKGLQPSNSKRSFFLESIKLITLVRHSHCPYMHTQFQLIWTQTPQSYDQINSNLLCPIIYCFRAQTTTTK